MIKKEELNKKAKINTKIDQFLFSDIRLNKSSS
jgi:hypothetical protein